MKITKTIISAALMLFAGFVQAASITKPFEVVVQNVNNGAEVGIVAGNVFQGQLSYDDNFLTQQQDGNFLAGSDTLQIDFAFNFPQNFTPPQLFVNSATFSQGGALVNLDFSIDIGNQFFFSMNYYDPLKFNFEFSKLVDNNGEPEQVIVANGSGIVREPVVQTPLPGAAWLFLSGLGLLAWCRKRLNP